MTTKDLYNNLKVETVDAPATRTATLTGTGIDTQGYESLVVGFDVGASGDTLSISVKWDFTLEESDDNSTFTAVAADDLHNTAASVTVDAADEDETVVKFGYKGDKRYVRGVATKTGTHTNGTPIGIFAIKGHAHGLPVT